VQLASDLAMQANVVLRGLTARSRELRALDDAMRRQLGPPLDGHCRLANLRADTVVLHVDSPVWSTRIRFLTPQLLEFFHRQRDCAGVTHIKIVVRPPRSHGQHPAASPLRLSPASASMIRSVALATEESPLREALLHLAKNGEQR
jgi:hypothetical protein